MDSFKNCVQECHNVLSQLDDHKQNEGIQLMLQSLLDLKEPSKTTALERCMQLEDLLVTAKNSLKDSSDMQKKESKLPSNQNALDASGNNNDYKRQKKRYTTRLYVRQLAANAIDIGDSNSLQAVSNENALPSNNLQLNTVVAVNHSKPEFSKYLQETKPKQETEYCKNVREDLDDISLKGESEQRNPHYQANPIHETQEQCTFMMFSENPSKSECSINSGSDRPVILDNSQSCTIVGSQQDVIPDTILDKTFEVSTESNLLPHLKPQRKYNKRSEKKKHVCPLCKQQFVRYRSYLIHLHGHGRSAVSCRGCRKVYSNELLLKEHNCRGAKKNKNAQPPDDVLSCTACSLSFASEEVLHKHNMTRCHMDKVGNRIRKLFQCGDCGKEFYRRAALERHGALHSDIKPYCCPHCDFRCRESTNLRRHIDYHFCHRRFTCVVCGSCFHAKRTLQTHYTYKHSTERNHVCSECGKAFKTTNSLQRHCQTHKKQRPHQCPICDLAFHRFYNLRRHMRTIHKDDSSLPPTRRLTLLDVPSKQQQPCPVTSPVREKITLPDFPVESFRAGGTVPNQQLHSSSIESTKTVSYNVTPLFYPNALDYV